MLEHLRKRQKSSRRQIEVRIQYVSGFVWLIDRFPTSAAATAFGGMQFDLG